MTVPPKVLTVIIADDDGTTRGVLRMLLRENGHQVLAEAHDGERAVELCETHKPDIAFLDIDMPLLNGHRAAEKIRQGAPGVRMIMVSAIPTLENVQSALQAGAGAFVVKPFNAQKVEAAIEQCMKHGSAL